MMMMTKKGWRTRRVMWRISTTRPSVSQLNVTRNPPREGGGYMRARADMLALKEDDQEAALKAFKAIVDEQPEKGEWYVFLDQLPSA